MGAPTGSREVRMATLPLETGCPAARPVKVTVAAGCFLMASQKAASGAQVRNAGTFGSSLVGAMQAGSMGPARRRSPLDVVCSCRGTVVERDVYLPACGCLRGIAPEERGRGNLRRKESARRRILDVDRREGEKDGQEHFLLSVEHCSGILIYRTGTTNVETLLAATVAARVPLRTD